MTNPEGRWNAVYYDGQTPARQPVTVTATRDGIRIHREDGSTIHWTFTGVRRLSRQSGLILTRTVNETGAQETILVEDQSFGSFLHGVAGLNAQHLNRRYGIKPSTVAVVAGVAIAVLSALYFLGIPVMAERVAAKVPLEWEENLGAGLVGDLIEPGSFCRDSVSQAALEQIVNRLAAPLNSRYTFRISIVRDDAINAFAAPGGYIVVNTGLIHVTSRPEELSGVLAHEMAHVTNQHGSRAVLRQIPLRLVMALATGEVSGAVQLLGAVGIMRYSRRDEADADRTGLLIIQAANVDPRGMLDVYKTLEREAAEAPGVLQWASSHPRTADRIEQLQSEIRAETGATPLIPNVNWNQVRDACVDSDDSTIELQSANDNH